MKMASDESSDDSSMKDSPRTVIIGAGISGIAAGNTLANAGFHDFVILEATDRIGGRIHSIDLGGYGKGWLTCIQGMDAFLTAPFDFVGVWMGVQKIFS